MAATRTKTIEVMLPTLTGFATGVAYNTSADTTVYIPETTSRVFKSVTLEMVCRDIMTTAYNLSGFGLETSCDSGVNWTTKTLGSGYANSGENMSHEITVDMTAEFVARFGTGATGTVRWGVYLNYATGTTINNATAKLYITYVYDDTAHTTRVKTVRIPIESFNGRLSNAAQAIKQTNTAANQIPALDTFLPEASKTYRQIYLELWTNTNPSTTTDATLYMKIDVGGGETSFPIVEDGMQTPLNDRYLWDLTLTLNTASAHELYARHDVAGQTVFQHLGGWLTVTYEYDHSTSTTILNSLVFGCYEQDSNIRASDHPDKFDMVRFIQEPDTITLVQSAVFVTAQTGTTSGTLSLGVGSQTVTGYTPTSATGQAGSVMVVHRIDAGGHRGAGITLARGENAFFMQAYGSTTDYFGNMTAVMILNYTSGKHASGDGVHAHSVYWLLFGCDRAATANVLPTIVTPEIIETNYYLLGVAPLLYLTGIQGALSYYLLQAERTAGEGPDGGWLTVMTSQNIAPNERQFHPAFGVCRPFFKRWPNDTDSERMNLETARSWRYYGISANVGCGMWITYHNITYTATGTVSGYTSDGSGIDVRFYRSDTKQYIGNAATVAGGTFSFIWYDNVQGYIAEARQDATHVARAETGNPT